MEESSASHHSLPARSVLATQEVATPRLILKDSMDDNGDHERAGLIRRMVALPTRGFAQSLVDVPG
jgi:uncharacterized protein (TIGR02996 family)